MAQLDHHPETHRPRAADLGRDVGVEPKGHIEHDLHLVDDGDTTWVTVEPGTGDALRVWLESMRFMLRVEVADRTADYAVLGEPHGAEAAPGELLAWRDPWPGLVGTPRHTGRSTTTPVRRGAGVS